MQSLRIRKVAKYVPSASKFPQRKLEVLGKARFLIASGGLLCPFTTEKSAGTPAMLGRRYVRRCCA
jgi:hypothetical protein